MGNRLFVGNLAFQTSEDDLQSAFGALGAVEEVKIVLDRESGRSRGFGFIRMGTHDDAQRAIAELNGTMMDGRALRVDEAQERSPRPSSGEQRGRGGDRW